MTSRALSRLLGADRALLRAACDAAPDTLWVLDRAGRILNIAGEPDRWHYPSLEALPEPARHILGAALRESVAATAEADLPVPHRLRFAPTAVGAMAGVLHVTDLGHQRTLETQLRQAQRLQAVGELAAGVAHDFNNLLTAILGATADLRGRAAVADIADLEQIRESAERGAALIRQLMAFGRQQVLQPRTLPVDQAVRAAASLLQRLLGPQIELRLELEEPGRRVRIDPDQFDRVLVNLAMNAAHAMPEGGRLTIATGHSIVLRPRPLGAETVPPGRYATIEMRDTGSGIPPDILPRIFEPFFTTRRDAGGTGLGLATVHGIVRQSGGYLGVESTLGRGTSFLILLPRNEAERLPAPPPQPAAPMSAAPCYARNRRRLLLVEDEAPVRKLAARALERAGYDVLACDCAQAALEQSADLDDGLGGVVSDVVMPGMDGPALVRALRLRIPSLPAVLISGYADAQARQALSDEQIVFLAKPFAMAELAAAVEAAANPLGSDAETPSSL